MDNKEKKTREAVFNLEFVEKVKASQNEPSDPHIFDITVQSPDRDKEVILVDGLDIGNYTDIPVVLADHTLSIQAIIGRSKWIRKYGDRLRAKVIYAPTQLGQEVKALVEGGFIRGASIRFIPYEWTEEPDKIKAFGFDPDKVVRVYTKSELLEWSLVAVPSNPKAMTTADIGRAETKTIDEDEKVEQTGDEKPEQSSGSEEADSEINKAVVKSVTPFLDLEIVDQKWDATKSIKQLRKWASSDGSGNPDTIDWNKYRKGFFWRDDENKDKFTAYKLPYCYVQDGKLVAVKRGLFAVMGALMGARGGVDIPEADRKKVYNVLVKYYKKMDVEPPEYKVVKFFYEAFVSILDPDVLGAVNSTGDTQRAEEKETKAVDKGVYVVALLKAMAEMLNKEKQEVKNGSKS